MPFLIVLKESTHLTRAFLHNKKDRSFDLSFYVALLDSTLDLIGTEASGTSVHMAGSTVNDSLDALDVGLPCTVGTSVGVGNLDTEGHALAAKITLSHFIAPPIWIIIIVRPSQALRYDTRLFKKMQALFYKFLSFFQNTLIFPFLTVIITANTRKRWQK